MVSRLQVKRTNVKNNPPADNSLLPGELYVEMSDPVRLWVGVPPALAASGTKLLLSDADLVVSVNGQTGVIALTANDVGALPDTGGDVSGPITVSGVPVSVEGHHHVVADVTDLQTALDAKQPLGSYAASVHTHTIPQVQGLQGVLDTKQPVGSYAPYVHTHTIQQVNNLQASLDSKASTTHYHTISQITGLQSALDVASQSVPSGAIVVFAGSVAPTGWLMCSGNAVSRTAYPSLFAAIGTTYGGGDGFSSFNLPDLRGRVPVGNDAMDMRPADRVTVGGSGIAGNQIGSVGGAERITLTTDQMPSHRHETTNSSGSAGDNSAGNAGLGTAGRNASMARVSNFNTTPVALSGYAGGGQPHLNMQPSLILNYLIKT